VNFFPMGIHDLYYRYHNFITQLLLIRVA
jgi:hypothetical protein